MQQSALTVASALHADEYDPPLPQSLPLSFGMHHAAAAQASVRAVPDFCLESSEQAAAPAAFTTHSSAWLPAIALHALLHRPGPPDFLSCLTDVLKNLTELIERAHVGRGSSCRWSLAPGGRSC